MAEIKDCIGKNIKISKTSITIKDDNGKTRGVVRNIASLYDMQPNKQMEYHKMLKSKGLNAMEIGISNFIIKDGAIYYFRNLESKKFHEKYGFFSDQEREKMECEEHVCKLLSDNGIIVIECMFV